MTLPLFQAQALGHRYDETVILEHLDFTIQGGEIVGILGPNGAGKTTLLRILGGLLKPTSGKILFEGTRISQWSRTRLAGRIAFLAQQTSITFPFTAREIVLMGRLPHQGGAFFESSEDHRIVDQSLAVTGCSFLADRFFNDLSGGEQQLVALASALAQEPDVLLLDEPTVYLDLHHRLQIFGILKDLHRDKGCTLVIVTHDLNLAEAFCSRLLLLNHGNLVADLDNSRREEPGGGSLTPELIANLYNVEASALEGEKGAERIILSFGS